MHLLLIAASTLQAALKTPTPGAPNTAVRSVCTATRGLTQRRFWRLLCASCGQRLLVFTDGPR